MIRTALVVLFALSPVAAAAESQLDFQAPTSLIGNQSGSLESGALSLVGHEGQIQLTGAQIVYETQEQAYTHGIDGVVATPTRGSTDAWTPVGDPGPGQATMAPSETWGLLVTGGSLDWKSTHGRLVGNVGANSDPVGLAAPYQPWPQVMSSPVAPVPSTILAVESVEAMTVVGDFEVVVFGLAGTLVRTSNEPIQSGHQETVRDPSGNEFSTIRYARLTVVEGMLTIDGGLRGGIVGPSINIDLNGSLHIPLATGELEQGTQLPNGTWHAEGNMQLVRIEPSETGRMSAQLIAPDASIMIDGKPVNEIPASVVVATTTTIGLVALALAILKGLPTATALLTRLPPEKALENANRKVIYSYITEHPGTTFREVLRGTDLAAGTARHHLTVLARSRMIVEHGHRSTLRYFENHGKFDATWSSVVLLREDDLAKVYNWLEANPEAIQRDLLEHAESTWSWSRSTTQHRLARLIDGGLVKFRQSGRRKIYEAVPADQAQAPMGPKTSWT